MNICGKRVFVQIKQDKTSLRVQKTKRAIADNQTDRQGVADGRTDRQTNRQTGRQTDRQSKHEDGHIGEKYYM